MFSSTRKCSDSFQKTSDTFLHRRSCITIGCITIDRMMFMLHQRFTPTLVFWKLYAQCDNTALKLCFVLRTVLLVRVCNFNNSARVMFTPYSSTWSKFKRYKFCIQKENTEPSRLIALEYRNKDHIQFESSMGGGSPDKLRLHRKQINYVENNEKLIIGNLNIQLQYEYYRLKNQLRMKIFHGPLLQYVDR
ncbi:hypothetical protein BC833DRAFT_568959 [Globomyces pollinis-pini]|nr:hypothetical protein BC833DRAFT_568959 [Globomyces pollinis-pini]